MLAPSSHFFPCLWLISFNIHVFILFCVLHYIFIIVFLQKWVHINSIKWSKMRNLKNESNYTTVQPYDDWIFRVTLLTFLNENSQYHLRQHPGIQHRIGSPGWPHFTASTPLPIGREKLITKIHFWKNTSCRIIRHENNFLKTVNFLIKQIHESNVWNFFLFSRKKPQIWNFFRQLTVFWKIFYTIRYSSWLSFKQAQVSVTLLKLMC